MRRVAAMVLEAAFGDLSRRNQRQLSHIRGAKSKKDLKKGGATFFLKILICLIAIFPTSSFQLLP